MPYDSTHGDKAFRRRIRLFQASKVLSLGGVAMGFVLLPGLLPGFILLAAYGLLTLWETERCASTVLHYRSEIQRLSSEAQVYGRDAHGR